jgi:Tfp pilus assembly protein PilX
MTKSISRSNNQEGYLLLLVIAISFVLMGLGLSIISVTSSKYARTTRDIDSSKAVYAAEAGISDTLAQLNSSASFTGFSTKKTFYSGADTGKAEYTTSIVQNATDGTATITSTSYLSRNPSDTTPFTTKTVKVIALKTKVPITENVIAGSAGFTISGGYIPWFGQATSMNKGSVYSRGKIRLNGTATSIGTTTDSARVTAANLGCGTTANFPQQCASNDPPITLGGGSIFSSGMGNIYGSVCATNQTSTTNIFPGPTGTGLQAGCIAPDYGMPYFDKKAFTDTKILPMLPAVASCPLFGIGAPIWLDNSRIMGSVSLTGSYFTPCTATLTGDVYIKGDLTIGSNARINVSTTLGSRKPVIVVNGKVNLQGDAIGIFANSSNSPVTIISFSSTNTSCSNSDDNNCTLS